MNNKSHIPATQIKLKDKIYRKFSQEVNIHELKWHWDEKNRVVKVLNDSTWFIQFDNKFPEKLEKGSVYYIKSGEWHRVIKGQGDLEVIISEN